MVIRNERSGHEGGEAFAVALCAMADETARQNGATGGMFGAQGRGPIYVSAKRTHRFFDGKWHLSISDTMGYRTKFRVKSVGSFSKTNPPVRGFGGVWGDLLTRLGSDLGVFCGDGRGHDVHHSGQRSGHNGAPKRIRGRRGPPRQTAQFGLPGDGIWGISSSLPGVPVVPGRIEISDE